MNIENEVKKLEKIIIPYIIEYFENYSLNDLYSWDKFDYNINLFTNDEITILDRLNSFEKNVKLKSIINGKLSRENFNKELYEWIINKWGGIRKFKNISGLECFLILLNNGKYLSNSTIASFSKVASFKYLNKYFIYDAHVSCAINWILIKNGDFNIKFFPFKFGENKDISENYNLKTILTLINSNVKYYDENFYYFIYCELLNSIFENIKNDIIQEPFYIEMMLFSISKSRKIINEIKEKIEIIIK